MHEALQELDWAANRSRFEDCENEEDGEDREDEEKPRLGQSWDVGAHHLLEPLSLGGSSPLQATMDQSVVPALSKSITPIPATALVRLRGNYKCGWRNKLIELEFFPTYFLIKLAHN